VLAIQGIIGRNVAPLDTAVLSVGHLAGGSYGSPNVIPSEVMVRGTARSYRPAVRDLLERRMGEVARATAEAWGCRVEYTYQRRYPALVNEREKTEVAIAAARATVGAENVDPNTPPITGAEDFAFMLEKKPGAYIMIGNGVDSVGGCHYVHTPHYDFNDEIILTGAAYWLNVVREEMQA
jgi:hippurate hydrolase